MPSDLMWKAGEIYDRVFQFLPMMPFCYDSKARRIIHVKEIRKIIPWIILAFGVCGMLCSGPKALQLAYLVIIPDWISGRTQEDYEEFNSVIQWLSIVVVVFSASCPPVVGFFAFIYGSDMTLESNSLLKIEEHLKKRAKKRKKRKKRKLIKKKNIKADVFGLLLCSLPFLILIFSPIFIGFSIYAQADALYFVFKVILRINLSWRNNFLVTFIALILRFVLLTIAAIDIMRHLFAIGYVITMAVWILNDSLKLLDKDYKECQSIFPKLYHVRLYQGLVLTMRIAGDHQASFLSFALLGVGISIVFFILLTIRGYELLPLNLYCLGIIILIALTTIVHASLPLAIQGSEYSKNMLLNWRYDHDIQKNVKYYSKLMNTLQPIKLYVGMYHFNFYLIDRDFNFKYYSAVQDYAITVLISYSL